MSYEWIHFWKMSLKVNFDTLKFLLVYVTITLKMWFSVKLAWYMTQVKQCSLYGFMYSFVKWKVWKIGSLKIPFQNSISMTPKNLIYGREWCEHMFSTLVSLPTSFWNDNKISPHVLTEMIYVSLGNEFQEKESRKERRVKDSLEDDLNELWD